MLDVGCGRGDLARAFGRLTWDVRGLDLSPQAVAVARSAGVDAAVGTIEEAPWPAGSFDLVVMSHVLEHVADPGATLSAAHRLLRPGGTLIVAVPNFASWQRRVFGSRWAHLDAPRHLHHFTPCALGLVARRAGFRRGTLRGNTSATGFPISVSLAVLGRPLPRARQVFLGGTLVLYPAVWLLGRAAGGDCIYLVVERE